MISVIIDFIREIVSPYYEKEVILHEKNSECDV